MDNINKKIQLLNILKIYFYSLENSCSVNFEGKLKTVHELNDTLIQILESNNGK